MWLQYLNQWRDPLENHPSTSLNPGMEPPLLKDGGLENADHASVHDALSTYIGKRLAKIKE